MLVCENVCVDERASVRILRPGEKKDLSRIFASKLLKLSSKFPPNTLDFERTGFHAERPEGDGEEERENEDEAVMEERAEEEEEEEEREAEIGRERGEEESFEFD